VASRREAGVIVGSLGTAEEQLSESLIRIDELFGKFPRRSRVWSRLYSLFLRSAEVVVVDLPQRQLKTLKVFWADSSAMANSGIAFDRDKFPKIEPRLQMQSFA
jgi:hypothetical protein